MYGYNSKISDVAAQFGLQNYAQFIKDPNLPSDPAAETGVGNQLDRAVKGDCKAPSANGICCTGYTDTCSDTNHQGRYWCTSVTPIGVFCFWTPKRNTSRSGYVLENQPREIWDWENTQRSTVMVLLRTLFSGVTVLGIDSRYFTTFATPNADGFVPYINPRLRYDPTAKKLVNDIGLDHYVLLVGYISNKSLAAKLPNAPRASEPGYFILKNFWGDCWGDTGYVYVPWDWIKNYGGQASLFV